MITHQKLGSGRYGAGEARGGGGGAMWWRGREVDEDVEGAVGIER